MKERAVDLRIGTRAYTIFASDQYLRQLRPGFGRQVETTIRRLLRRNSFEPRITSLLGTLVRSGGVALDVGANIGCTAIYLSQFCQTVVAFEPIPMTNALLRRNLEANQVGNVSVQNCALGAQEILTSASYSEDNRSGAFIADAVACSVEDGVGDAVGRVGVSVRRLDSLWPELGLQSLDLMKIDVEGYELNVLNGAQRTLGRFKPLVEMECNSWCLNVMQRTALPDFVEALVDLFPELYAVERDRFIDLRGSNRWQFYEQNVLHQRFRELVGGYADGRLDTFRAAYRPA